MDPAATSQVRQKLLHIGRDGRLETLELSGHRVTEREAIGMEGLTLKGDRLQALDSLDVSLFANEDVAVQTRLKPDLISPSRVQPKLDERRSAECLDHVVSGLGIATLLVARVGRLLNK